MGSGVDNDYFLGHISRYDFLSVQDYARLYKFSWLAKRAIDAVPNDSTKSWRIWNLNEDERDRVERLEKALHYRDSVNQALKYSRLYGSAFIVKMYQRDNAMDKPLGPNPGKLINLVVYPGRDVRGYTINEDPFSRRFGDLLDITIRQGNSSFSGQIHYTRLIFFHEDKDPTLYGLNDSVTGFELRRLGLPILTPLINELNGYEILQTATRTLSKEAKVDVYQKTADDNVEISQEVIEKEQGQIEVADQNKAFDNSLSLQGGWDFKRIMTDFSGVNGALDRQMLVLAGALQIPESLLFGKATSGLSTSSKEDLRVYYDSIRAYQENRISPPLRETDMELINMAEVPETATYDWAPLWQNSDLQEKEVERIDILNRSRRIANVKSAQELGVFTSDDVNTAIRDIMEGEDGR